MYVFFHFHIIMSYLIVLLRRLDTITGIKLPILALGFAGTLSAILISIERAISWTEEVRSMARACTSLT